MTSPVDAAPHGTPPFLELFPRACPVCGSAEATEIAPANFDPARLDSFAFASRKLPEYMHLRLVVCTACDMLYATPAPLPGTLATAYEGAAFDASQESHFAARTYGSYLPGIASRLPDQVGALDIGTGDGAFLEQLLAKGFADVVGIEPSTAPIAAAAPAVRDKIRHAVFRSGDFSAEQFRLVTCFQTIEHVPDPLSLCKEALRILKPQGALFIVCHNRKAMLARLMGRRSPIYDIEHLQLFSRQSIRKLLQQAGFRDVQLHTVINRYPVSYWARLLPASPRLKDKLLSTLAATGLAKLPIAAPVGNLAAIAWR